MDVADAPWSDVSVDSAMDWEQARAAAHVGAALGALVVGAAVFAVPKGTTLHRFMGAGYAALLLAVNLAALSLRREDAFSVFHALALISLVTLAVGLVPLLLGHRSPRAIVTHAYCMTWSYAGLLAAGFGQLAAANDAGGGWLVPVTIGAVLLACAAVIVRRVPPALSPVLTACPRTP
jgi:uncharacterized membrane protein